MTNMDTTYPIHKAPYTNFHDMNLDWIIEALNEFNRKLANFVSLNTIKYADPIKWDIISQYAQNTLVLDPQDGTAYLSVQPVPQGCRSQILTTGPPCLPCKILLTRSKPLSRQRPSKKTDRPQPSNCPQIAYFLSVISFAQTPRLSPKRRLW